MSYLCPALRLGALLVVASVASVAAAPLAPCQDPVTIHGILVRGQVVDASGQPVAKASVHGGGPDPATRELLAECDEDGRFELHGLHKGTRLTARAAGRQPSPPHVVYHPGIHDVELRLGTAGTPRSGRIVDAAGRAASDVVIAFTRGPALADESTWVARTDESGLFTTDPLPAGDLIWLARRDAPQDGSVGVGGFSDAGELRLGSGATLSGRLHDAAGRPRADVELEARLVAHPLLGDPIAGLRSLVDRRAHTDAGGHFAFDGLLAGHYSIRYATAGKWHELHALEVRGGEHHVIEIEQARTWELLVRVRDPEGRPLPNWVVYLPPDPEVGGRSDADRRRTDAAGEVLATGIPGDEAWLTLHVPDPPNATYPWSYVPALVRRVSRSTEEITLTVDPNFGSFAGRVLDSAGNPVPKTMIEVRRPDSPEVHGVLSDADGRFVFDPLVAGPHDLTFIPRNGVKGHLRIDVAPGTRAELGDITLPGGAVLEVTLSAEDGGAITRPQLWLSRDGERVAALRRAPNETVWRSAQVPLGKYRLHLVGDDVAPTSQELEPSAGTHRVQVVAARGVVQDFVVELADPVFAQRGHGYVTLLFCDAAGRPVSARYFDGRIGDERTLLCSVALTPGEYSVDARGRSDQALVVFTVKPDPDPVRIELR